jgi:hypothetical protein
VWYGKKEHMAESVHRITDPQRGLDERYFPEGTCGPMDLICAPSWHSEYRLDPGSVSPAHREALLFGATEHDRLAAEPWTPSDALRRKAKALRDLANK